MFFRPGYTFQMFIFTKFFSTERKAEDQRETKLLKTNKKKKAKNVEWAFDTADKTPPGTPVSHIRGPGFKFWIHLFLLTGALEGSGYSLILEA